jgi:serine/threonine protein kinase/tetratricopeptide (TPR) repeat protein
VKCLLRGALDEDAVDVGKQTFKDLLTDLHGRDASWRIRNFQILDEVGRGGMGVIYRAREMGSQRIVALKRVLSYHADSDQTLARFHREAETAAKLDHPNIVPIYYVGESEDGLPFFSMKYAAGGSLLQAREAYHRDPRKSVLLMAKVALALQYAHEQGVLHRDLKPSNILLSNRSEPMVSDFGLAKWLDTSSELTRTLTIFGTPGYIAPEQAAGPGPSLTVAADVYSLGAILFELLTGRPPFLGEHALNVIRQAAEKPAPKLRLLAPHLDRDLETICARCLEREPAARYQSAASLAQDLQNWLECRPIIARPVSILARFWRWFRRNRVIASTLTVFLVISAISIPWQIHGWKLQSAARESALAARSVAVLPFYDLDKIAPDEVLTQSIASSLQRELDLAGPAVVRRPTLLSSAGWQTVEQIRRVGETAKARAVLTGTVRMVQAKMRISLRLLEASTGEPLLVRVWEVNGRKYSQANVIKEIGATINDRLNTKDWSNLTQSKTDSGLRNETAREAMMAGRQLLFRYTAVDIDRAIDLFRKAVRAEPTSSLAHAYLAIAATGRTHYISDKSFLELGRTEATEALRLSPDSSDAHRALAGVFYQQGNFTEALTEELQTIEFAGMEEGTARFVGMTLDVLGHPDHALSWYGLVRQLSGPPGDVEGHIGDCLVKLCDDERAQRAYERADELQPDRYQGLIGMCHLRLLQGDVAEARELSRRLTHDGLDEGQQIAAQIEFFARKFDVAEKLYGELLEKDKDGGGTFYGALTFQSALGRAKQAIGDMPGGNRLLKICLVKETAAAEHEPTNPEALCRLAAVEASLGMSDSSLQHLHKATNLGWLDYRSLARDPRFDSLRQNADFQAIIKDLAIKVAAMRASLQDFTKIAQY